MLTPNESMGNVTTDTKPIRPIAIVGTGVMGASWSAQFLAKRALRIGIPIATSVQEIQLTFAYFQTYSRKPAQSGGAKSSMIARINSLCSPGLAE